jgi:hypothetical protein
MAGKRIIGGFWKDTSGQDLIEYAEYALAAGMVAVVAVAVMPTSAASSAASSRRSAPSSTPAFTKSTEARAGIGCERASHLDPGLFSVRLPTGVVADQRLANRAPPR